MDGNYIISERKARENTTNGVNTMPNTIKIGKCVYVIERHFSGDRDIRDAVYAVVKNEAFRGTRAPA